MQIGGVTQVFAVASQLLLTHSLSDAHVAPSALGAVHFIVRSSQ